MADYTASTWFVTETIILHDYIYKETVAHVISDYIVIGLFASPNPTYLVAWTQYFQITASGLLMNYRGI